MLVQAGGRRRHVPHVTMVLISRHVLAGSVGSRTATTMQPDDLHDDTNAPATRTLFSLGCYERCTPTTPISPHKESLDEDSAP